MNSDIHRFFTYQPSQKRKAGGVECKAPAHLPQSLSDIPKMGSVGINVQSPCVTALERGKKSSYRRVLSSAELNMIVSLSLLNYQFKESEGLESQHSSVGARWFSS